MSMPTVSVVMSVYNGEASLARTMESVLAQEGVDFEFIVVNDGSTDGSGRLLDDYALRDARVRVIHQENTGLTRALIHGCAAARGEFIARQDCGDASLPGRLAAQVDAFQGYPDRVMVASGTKFRAPTGAVLDRVTRPGPVLAEGLSLLDVQRIKGPPHHGSVMFRRDVYEAVGGYRAPFVVAQDLDLWLRLTERGCAWGLDEIHYEAEVSAAGISAERRDEQLRIASAAIECARARRSGGDDAPVLDTMLHRRRRPRRMLFARRRQQAAGLFFLATRLMAAGHRAAAREHLSRTILLWPLHWRAWLHLIRGALT